MYTVAENYARVFFIAGFFFLLLFTFQNIESKANGKEENESAKHTNLIERMKEAEKIVNDGDYKTAIGLLTQLTPLFEAEFGPEHLLTIFVLSLKQVAYFNIGNFDEALKVAWKIYKIQEKIHGQEHKVTGDALAQLGHMYLISKKYEKAESALKRAYRITKSQLGQNHKATIQILFNLADVYRENRDPDKVDLALRYYKKVYDFWSKDPDFGEQHPDTLQALENIGNFLGKQREFTEAAKVYQKLVEIRTKTLGEEHPVTQEAKNVLFHLLSSAGKIGEAKKVLGKEDQELDQDGDSLFTLVEGKFLAFAKNKQFDKAVELLAEFYQHEISKPQISPKALRVLEKLILHNRYNGDLGGDLDELLKWANEAMTLIKNLYDPQNQRVKFKVTTAEDVEHVIRLHLLAIASLLHVYSHRNDETKVNRYFRAVPEVIRGYKMSYSLVEPLLSITKQAADFKVKMGKKDEAVKILKDFADQNDNNDFRPRWGVIPLFSLGLMSDIAVNNDDFNMMNYMAQKFLANPRDPEDGVTLEQHFKIREDWGNALFPKANRFFENENYETAFYLYKVLDVIWPKNWTEDDELAQFVLQRIIKSALMAEKSDQVLFYMRKNVHILKNKLTTQPEMNVDEREKISQEIEQLENFQEEIKIAGEIPSHVKEYQNAQDFSWPESNYNKRGKSEL